MTRKADEAARRDLLERISAYVLENGVASLSLRPLAKELGVSAASLLYYFGSKEELTVAILRHLGDRQRELFAAMRVREGASPAEVCRAVWKTVGDPRARPLFKLFFEVYGLALVDPGRFPEFFPGAIENWLRFLEPAYVRGGMNKRDARTCATVVLAGFRGFLLDVCATGDQARVDRAVESWIERLE